MADKDAPAPPVQPWKVHMQKLAPELEKIKHELSANPTSKDVKILRVNQLDAQRLDEELTEILQAQFLKMFSFFQADFVERFRPELNAALQFLIFRLSVYHIDTSYGSRMQNLKYLDADNMKSLTGWQKTLYGILQIGGPWLWDRLNRYSTSAAWGDNPSESWQRRAWKAITLFETTFKLLSVVNFLVFLVEGKYRSLLDRALRMRLVYIHPLTARAVSFEWMNRQLVWHGFTEFLLFILPLINVERIKSFFVRQFSSRRLQAAVAQGTCPICSSSPVNTPYKSNCGHVFCYFCIKQNCMADSTYPCPSCGVSVTTIARVEGEQ